MLRKILYSLAAISILGWFTMLVVGTAYPSILLGNPATTWIMVIIYALIILPLIYKKCKRMNKKSR